VVILVCPCPDGISRSHAREILKVGYRPLAEIKRLVQDGSIRHRVVGVHMAQVIAVAEKARLILVTPGIRPADIRKMDFSWAPTPQKAFEEALAQLGGEPAIAVLEGAARMLVLKDQAADRP
jgi:hypothetical protein